jgi:hypothetical protein
MVLKSLKQIPLKVYKKVFYIPDPDKLIVPTDYHSFIDSILFASDNKVNLKLSVNDLWLVLLQNMSFYLNNSNFHPIFNRKSNAEFVGNTLEELIISMTTQILDIPDCNCINSTNKIACKIASLSSYNAGILYDLTGSLTIRKIILDDTLEDWQNLKKKLLLLVDYNLESYISDVIPIVDQFIDLYENKIDHEFWTNKNWIIKLFPTERFPHGLRYIDAMIEKKRYTVTAGFLGNTICHDTNTISPNIGWYIEDRVNRLSNKLSRDMMSFSKVDVVEHEYNKSKCCFQ